MTRPALHLTPRFRDVVREQIRIVKLNLRPVALVAVIVIAIVAVPIVMDIVRGNAESWFDSDDWSPIGIGAFLLPFAVWRGEKRFGPASLWTLPVDRRRHAFAKVFAGWLWMIVALTAFVLWENILALIARVPNAETIQGFAFIGATAMYLFGSALLLGFRHPLRWLLGTAAVTILTSNLHERYVDQALASAPVRSAIESAMASTQTLPELLRLIIASLLLLATSLTAVWLASLRHRERRSR